MQTYHSKLRSHQGGGEGGEEKKDDYAENILLFERWLVVKLRKD